MRSVVTKDNPFRREQKVFDHLLLDTYFAIRLLRDRGVIVFDDTRMAATRKVISFIEKYYRVIEVDYGDYGETWKQQVWFAGIQSGRIGRPYRAFIRPRNFNDLPAIVDFEFWRRFQRLVGRHFRFSSP